MMMKFGTFRFPHCPETLKITVTQPLQLVQYPSGVERQESYGKAFRKVVCKGTLLGNDTTSVESLWQAFLAVPRQEPSSILVLPNGESFVAVLQSYTTELSGDGNYLPYELTFVEAYR